MLTIHNDNQCKQKRLWMWVSYICYEIPWFLPIWSTSNLKILVKKPTTFGLVFFYHQTQQANNSYSFSSISVHLINATN